MQYSTHLPTPFIRRHSKDLLPDWSCQIGSILIALQRPACELITRNHITETQKDLLREAFLEWGRAIALQLRQIGHLADPFDPKTGQPLLSSPGRLWLDDVAITQACLGYSTTQVEGCCVLLHPFWGSAVYPSVILSSAPPELIKGVASSTIWSGGFGESNSWCRTRSEYHHSFIG